MALEYELLVADPESASRRIKLLYSKINNAVECMEETLKFYENDDGPVGVEIRNFAESVKKHLA